jgi:hypothetical protein
MRGGDYQLRYQSWLVSNCCLLGLVWQCSQSEASVHHLLHLKRDFGKLDVRIRAYSGLGAQNIPAYSVPKQGFPNISGYEQARH